VPQANVPNPNSAQEFNQLYRKMTINQKEKPAEDGNLKNFYLKVNMHKDTVKTVSAGYFNLIGNHYRFKTCHQVQG
jgi:hypothetical protein